MKLSLLKEAFAPLSKIGILERTFDVQGIQITLRTLNSKQEAQVQKKISELNEDQELNALEYVDHFRKESISLAIVKVGDISLSEEYIETDEVLENGTPVKVPRYEAVREILDSLSRNVLNEIFNHLAKLSEEAEGQTTTEIQNPTESLEEKEQLLTSQLEEVTRQKNHQKVVDISADVVKSSYDDALKNMG